MFPLPLGRNDVVKSSLHGQDHDNAEAMWARYFSARPGLGSFDAVVHLSRSLYHGRLFARRVRTLGGAARSYLEIGAGTGASLHRLRRITGACCWGVDKTPNACRAVRANGRACPIVRADGLFLPFGDRSFDVVYSLGLLEHFPERDQRRLLREHARVARKAVLLHLPARVPHLRLLLWLNRSAWGRSGVWADEELFTPAVFRAKFPRLPFRHVFDVAAGAMSFWFILRPEDVLHHVARG